MTQQEIQERNKQIALMLGKKLISKNEFIMLGENAYTGNNAKIKWAIIEYLAYHNNWNWLMEAVEFIERTNIVITFFYECQILKYQGTIGKHNPPIIWTQGKDKREAIFLAVSDFAKKYNNGELH